MLQIAIINGPNLNLLGIREPHIYGQRDFETHLAALRERFSGLVEIDYFQSNIEGEIINFMHQCIGSKHGFVINAGAYSHTSIAIADAVSGTGIPTVEVHISNIMAREEYRKHSYISAKSIGTISGLGLDGYALAIRYFVDAMMPGR